MSAVAAPGSTSYVQDIISGGASDARDFPGRSELGHLPGASGALAAVRNLVGWMRSGNEHLLQQRKQYGPIYRHVLGRVPMVFVADADALGVVARNEERAFSSELGWKAFFEGINPQRSTFDSLAGMDFERHRNARKVVQPTFTSAAIGGYVQRAIPLYERASRDWLNEGHVALKPAVRRLFAEVSGSIFIGIDDAAQSLRTDRMISDWWGAPFALAKHPLLSTAFRRAMRADRRLRAWFAEKVTDRLGASGDDLFTRMCNVRESAPWLDDELLIGLVISVMAASFDTTSLAIASMGYILATHPDWQERLREEAAGTDLVSDLGRLPLLDSVWKETLRLYPVAAGLPRCALRDVELLDRKVPAGSFIIALIGPVLHDERWWTRPSTFDPERFSPRRAEDKRHRSAFMPFGAGAHACMGAQLATLEAKAFFHVLLSKCRIRLAAPYEARHQYRPIGSVSGNVELVLERL